MNVELPIGGPAAAGPLLGRSWWAWYVHRSGDRLSLGSKSELLLIDLLGRFLIFELLLERLLVLQALLLLLLLPEQLLGSGLCILDFLLLLDLVDEVGELLVLGHFFKHLIVHVYLPHGLD